MTNAHTESSVKPYHRGSNSLYAHGCRCQPCRDAHHAYWRNRTSERTATLASDPGYPVTHGTWSTYLNWGCRCSPCTSAASAKGARWRNRISA